MKDAMKYPCKHCCEGDILYCKSPVSHAFTMTSVSHTLHMAGDTSHSAQKNINIYSRWQDLVFGVAMTMKLRLAKCSAVVSRQCQSIWLLTLSPCVPYDSSRTATLKRCTLHTMSCSVSPA